MCSCVRVAALLVCVCIVLSSICTLRRAVRDQFGLSNSSGCFRHTSPLDSLTMSSTHIRPPLLGRVSSPEDVDQRDGGGQGFRANDAGLGGPSCKAPFITAINMVGSPSRYGGPCCRRLSVGCATPRVPLRGGMLLCLIHKSLGFMFHSGTSDCISCCRVDLPSAVITVSRQRRVTVISGGLRCHG